MLSATSVPAQWACEWRSHGSRDGSNTWTQEHGFPLPRLMPLLNAQTCSNEYNAEPPKWQYSSRRATKCLTTLDTFHPGNGINLFWLELLHSGCGLLLLPVGPQSAPVSSVLTEWPINIVSHIKMQQTKGPIAQPWRWESGTWPWDPLALSHSVPSRCQHEQREGMASWRHSWGSSTEMVPTKDGLPPSMTQCTFCQQSIWCYVPIRIDRSREQGVKIGVASLTIKPSDSIAYFCHCNSELWGFWGPGSQSGSLFIRGYSKNPIAL